MLEVVESHDLDLLHVHYAIPHAISAFLAREMSRRGRLKVVTTLHGTDITIVGGDKSYFPVTRFGIEKSDGVTTVSEYLRVETQKIFGIRKPIDVIPNFVDSQRFRPDPDSPLRKLFAEPGESVLLHMSNFRPVKKIPVVIRTFADVAARMPARLLMVGDGPEHPLAESMARDLGLADRVRFLGQQERVERIFQIADLYLIPSEFESFGLSALEAMACGVPVIGARGGGLPELVVDGETGFLCDAGDAGAMGAAAIEILSDEKRLREMKARCRRRAVDHYDESAMVARYVEHYERVLRGA
jgi:N-acetyl-alpha-D-glucosaminyl L-malate synthase BshA